jgi:hypothetical protein
MVEPDAFEVGVDLAVTPGSVVLRTPVFELIQYRPATPTVRQVPLLIVRREGAIPMPISPEHRYGQVSIHLDRQAYSWRWRRA